MGIRRNDVAHAFGQEFLRPVEWPLPKTSRQRARRNLHPDATLAQPFEHVELVLDPPQPFGVRNHRHIPRRHQFKNRLLHIRRRHMMRRFQQEVACAVDGGDFVEFDALDQPRHHVHVRALHQLDADALVVEDLLEAAYRVADALRVILIHARIDVRRAGDRRDAMLRGDPRHLQRHRFVFGAIVDARQDVAMLFNPVLQYTARAADAERRAARLAPPLKCPAVVLFKIGVLRNVACGATFCKAPKINIATARYPRAPCHALE